MSEKLIKDAIVLHNTRKRANVDCQLVSKRIKKETGLDAERINFLATCWMRRGEGWGNDKVSLEKGAELPDPLTTLFAKLVAVVATHEQAGLLCDLEPYLEDLKKYGINVQLEVTNGAYSKEVHDDVVQLVSYKQVVVECDEEIKQLGKEAEEENFVSKSKFSELASLAFKKSRGSDVEDSCQNQIKNALMTENAFSYLSNLDLD